MILTTPPTNVYGFSILQQPYNPLLHQTEMIFKKYLCWVQLSGLPCCLLDRDTIKTIGNIIGEYVRDDLKLDNTGVFKVSFVRILVNLLTDKPLVTSIPISRLGIYGDAVLTVKYECLEGFCPLCGVISYPLSLCKPYRRLSLERNRLRSNGKFSFPLGHHIQVNPSKYQKTLTSHHIHDGLFTSPNHESYEDLDLWSIVEQVLTNQNPSTTPNEAGCIICRAMAQLNAWTGLDHFQNQTQTNPDRQRSNREDGRLDRVFSRTPFTRTVAADKPRAYINLCMQSPHNGSVDKILPKLLAVSQVTSHDKSINGTCIYEPNQAGPSYQTSKPRPHIIFEPLDGSWGFNFHKQRIQQLVRTLEIQAQPKPTLVIGAQPYKGDPIESRPNPTLSPHTPRILQFNDNLIPLPKPSRSSTITHICDLTRSPGPGQHRLLFKPTPTRLPDPKLRPTNTHFAFPTVTDISNGITSSGKTEPLELGYSSTDSSGWRTPSHLDLFPLVAGSGQSVDQALIGGSRKRNRSDENSDEKTGVSEGPAKICDAQKRPTTDDNSNHEQDLQQRLHHLLEQKEATWRDKSRELWLKAGDMNTKFFHISTICRRRHNEIKKICRADGYDSARAADSEETEAISVIRGMEAAHRLGLDQVLLLTDCQRLVRAFRDRFEDLSWDAPTLAPDMHYPMTSKTLRRRLHHGDVDGKKRQHLDSLNEPLLGSSNYNDSRSEGNALGDSSDDDERKREHFHWALVFSHLIAQWAQWLANIVLGSGSLLGRLLMLPSGNRNGLDIKIFPLSPVQNDINFKSDRFHCLRLLVKVLRTVLPKEPLALHMAKDPKQQSQCPTTP
ncbi:hypothetical protein GIB67_010573 [Kingdonia uniflora]|uniref:Uncharacterized protein n=1 Tax=Kingdonia uniflora TaxID=39325 RepID=A0A7J7MAW4_9MAGN|nr:hypothetical protein GIB67_010573 [Kingdonia uniflora]